MSGFYRPLPRALAVASLVAWSAIALASCRGGSSKTDGSEGPVVIRLGHIGFPESAFDLGVRKFKELLEQRLPGKVEVRIHGAAQLGEDKEMLEGLRLGTLEMHVPSSVLHSVEPEFGLFDLPFLIENRAQMESIASGPVGTHLKERLLERDLVLLGFWENGFRVITNNVRPIEKPSDLEGIKLRTPKDPERVKLFRAFGANPTSMSFGEVFSALKQGVIDGQENPFSQIVPARFHEVQKYLSVSRHVYSPAYPLMSRRYFEGFSPEMQQAILEVSEEVGRFHRELGEREDERYRTLLEEVIEINEIDREAFEQAAESMYEEFYEKFGRENVDAIRAYRTTLAR